MVELRLRYRASRGNIGGTIFTGVRRINVPKTGIRSNETPRAGPSQLLDGGTLWLLRQPAA